jgi:hypothetical protein
MNGNLKRIPLPKGHGAKDATKITYYLLLDIPGAAPKAICKAAS